MMLRYSLGLSEEADAVERAVEGVLSEGFCTPDLARGGGEVVGTRQIGDLITGSL